MADFYSVSLEEMDALLRPMRFRPVDLTYRNRPVKEWVYQRPLPSRDNHFVRVYTGINRYGQKQNQSRERGKDAIRVQVIYRDPNGTETLVTQPKRVHRVRGWADNLGARLEEINRNRPQVVFDSRGIPMTLRKGKTGWFWGSRDYPRYKETRPFSAESDDEWGGLPVHEINSLEELIDIFESRYVAGVKNRYYRGGFKDVPQMAHTNYELLTNSLFKINFSGVYGVRTINGPSKVIYGVNLLQSNQVNQGSQIGTPTILKQTYPDADIVSVECPFIPTANLPRYRSKESKLEDLIEALKPHGGWLRKTKKNTIIFDMEGVVFAADLAAGGWDITNAGIKSKDLQLLNRKGWRPLKLSTRHRRTGEIEILGGVPQENIVYEEIPPVALNPSEVTPHTRDMRLTRTGRMREITGDDWQIPNNFSDIGRYQTGLPQWKNMTDEEMIEHWNQFASESAPLAGQTTEALYEIKIYVPSTNLDQPVSETEFQSRIDETQRKLSELFGGFTTTVGDGGYLSQEEGLISEPVMIVTSWANPKDYQNKLGELESFLREKQQTWGQEVIGFEFENDFFMFPEFEIYEAPYQPDQTMQDYTPSELTTSSAISGYQPYKYSASHGAESEEQEFIGEVPIIDLNSIKEIEEYGMFNPYEPTLDYKELKRRQLLTDAPENNNLFRITCDGVYAVRTIYGPSKIIFGRNMLASNKMYFNRSTQSNLSGVWRLMGLPRNNSGVVSAFGPLENIEKMPQFSEKPEAHIVNKQQELIPNRIVINMKGLVFAYDIAHREVEFYGGVPESSIVSQDIPPEVVKPEMAEPWNTRENARDYEYIRKRTNRKNRLISQGLKGEINVPDEEYIDYWNQFAAEDNYEATYGKRQAAIRRRLKKKIKAQNVRGTKAGEWSARKSQLLKEKYEAACERANIRPYKGKKTQSQKNLSNWSKQDWRTASGKKSSVTGEPYFPAKAVAALKKKGLYAKAKRQKAAATKAGKQNARYSDDIRAVVRKYRAEETPETDFSIGEILISDLIPNVGDQMLYIPYPTAESWETWLPNDEGRWKYIIAERFGDGEEDYSLQMWWSGLEEFVRLLEPEDAKKYLADYTSPADIFGKLFLSSEPVWEHLAFNKNDYDASLEWFNWNVNLDPRLRNYRPPASSRYGRTQIRLGDLDKINTNLDMTNTSPGKEEDYRKQQTIHPDQLPDAKSFLSESDDAPEFWEVREIINSKDGRKGTALYRKINDLTYNQVWRLLELIDDLNRMTRHHATTTFGDDTVEIWIYTHDTGTVEPQDSHWADDFNEMYDTVTWDDFESEWEVNWDRPKISYPSWGDDVEWNSSSQRSAAVVFVHQPSGRIGLQLRSSRVNEPWTWAGVGGYIDSGESPEQCARREITEELGLELNYPMRLVSREGGNFIFRMDVPDTFEPKLNWESIRFAWRTPEQWRATRNIHPELINDLSERQFGAEDEYAGWGSLRPETRPTFPTLDAQIAAMLRNHSKVNELGEQGCPDCGSVDLFYRETTGKGTKWYCYGCFYTKKIESMKSQKIPTLTEFGMRMQCPDCGEMVAAYNLEGLNRHRKKCGVKS